MLKIKMINIFMKYGINDPVALHSQWGWVNHTYIFTITWGDLCCHLDCARITYDIAYFWNKPKGHEVAQQVYTGKYVSMQEKGGRFKHAHI